MEDIEIRKRIIKKLLTDQKLEGDKRFIAIGFYGDSTEWLTDDDELKHVVSELEMMMKSNLTDIVIMIHKEKEK